MKKTGAVMIGQHKKNIDVVPYRSGWKELYEQEANLLKSTLGEKVLRIEHIGSTSIPGMEAKPIIDIMAGVVSLAQATELVPMVEPLGYVYKALDTTPERMFFAKERTTEYRTHHLNITQQGSGFWKNQIAFRDYLRVHKQVAAEYVDLKKHLARVYSRTLELDRDGKTEFVDRVLALAKEEARESK